MNSFDSLRLIGSLIVMAGHAFIITGSSPPMLGSLAIYSFGVCIFFSISGYLITQSWLSDPSLSRYLRRRALRITPALFVVATVTAVLIGACATTDPLVQYFRHGWTWRYIISNTALLTVWGLPGVFDTLPLHGQANGSLWTLPIEFGLYLTAPLLAMIRGRARAARWAIAAALVASALFLRTAWPPLYSVHLFTIDVGSGIALAPFFWVGAALRLVDFGEWPVAQRHGALALALVASLIWVWAGQPWLMPLGVVAISVVVLAIGLSPWFHSNALQRIGDLSYGTYLWAFPLQQFAMLKAGGGVTLNLLLTAPPTLLLAFLSWRLIERPALRFKPRRRAHPDEEIGPVTSGDALQWAAASRVP